MQFWMLLPWMFLFSIITKQSLANEPLPLNDYHLESWTTKSGLPHNSINAIGQTSDGYLWVATWEGIARFNGRDFKVFNKKNNDVFAKTSAISAIATCDNSNNLIATDIIGGVNQFKNNSWSKINKTPPFARALHCDSFNNVWAGLDSGETIKVSVSGNSNIFLGDSERSGGAVYSILGDSSGGVWVGTVKSAFHISDTLTVSDVYQQAGLQSQPTFSILKDTNEDLLLGTNDGVYRLKGNDLARLSPKLAGLTVSYMLLDSQHSLWVGTINNGLYRVSQLGVEKYTSNPLLNNRIITVFEDKEHNIWVGTNGGLMKLRQTPFSTFTNTRGLKSDFIRSLVELDNGDVLVGSSGGIDVIKDNEVLPFPSEANIVNESILSMAKGNNDALWIGTYTEGLTLLRRNNFIKSYKRVDGLAADEVRAILATDDKVYVGTSDGLSILSDSGFENFRIQDGMAGNFVLSMFQSKDDTVWIGTSTGINRIRKNGNLEKFELIDFPDVHFIFGFYENDESPFIWFATDAGLLRYNPVTEDIFQVNQEADLPFDKFFGIEMDSIGNFWLSGNQGILQVSESQVMEYIDGKIQKLDYRLFGESDGLISKQSNGGAGTPIVKKRDGSLWFATAKGVSKLDPDKLKISNLSGPPVAIEELIVDGVSMDLGQPIHLASDTERVEIHFSGLGLATPESIHLATFMEGIDSDWVWSTNRNLREYNNLPAGHYRFLIAAKYGRFKNEELSASQILEFQIHPKFWETKSFFITASLLAASFLYFIHILRLRNITKLKAKLHKKVAYQTKELQRQTDSLQEISFQKTKLLEELRLQSKKFEKMALEDPLTGLLNRRAFDAILSDKAAEQNAQGLCLLILDIDNFKMINDRFSHSVGDEVLACVAHALKSNCRDEDTIARWGGGGVHSAFKLK